VTEPSYHSAIRCNSDSQAAMPPRIVLTGEASKNHRQQSGFEKRSFWSFSEGFWAMGALELLDR